MATIVCFSDDATFGSQVRQNLNDPDVDVHVFPASRLANDVRDVVRKIAPNLVMLEMTPSFDNIHLFFFLRSDDATRETPVIMMSQHQRHAHQAEMLGADAFLPFSALREKLCGLIDTYMLRERAVAV